MQSDHSKAVEEYILEKVQAMGMLRPSQLYGIARTEEKAFTEQDLRRKIWTLVSRGNLELTAEMSLRPRASVGE
jgi:hypothetical protein